jgi:hypothetical protein
MLWLAGVNVWLYATEKICKWSRNMVREHDFVAIFHSIHRVMKAEKILKREKVEMLLIPVPRQLTSDCGLAIRYAENEKETIGAILIRENLLPEELYQKEDGSFRQVVSVG